MAPVTTTYPLPAGVGTEGMHRITDWILKQPGVVAWAVRGAELQVTVDLPEPAEGEEMAPPLTPLLLQLSPYEIYQRCARVEQVEPRSGHALGRLVEALQHPEGLHPLLLLIPAGAHMPFQHALGSIFHGLPRQRLWLGVPVQEDASVGAGLILVFYSPERHAGLVSTVACRIVELP